MISQAINELVLQLRNELLYNRGWGYTEYEKGRIAEKERCISLLEHALATHPAAPAQRAEGDGHRTWVEHELGIGHALATQQPAAVDEAIRWFEASIPMLRCVHGEETADEAQRIRDALAQPQGGA